MKVSVPDLDDSSLAPLSCTTPALAETRQSAMRACTLRRSRARNHRLDCEGRHGRRNSRGGCINRVGLGLDTPKTQYTVSRDGRMQWYGGGYHALSSHALSLTTCGVSCVVHTSSRNALRAQLSCRTQEHGHMINGSTSSRSTQCRRCCRRRRRFAGKAASGCSRWRRCKGRSST